MPSRRPNAAFLKKEPSATHTALAEWITKTTGHEVTSGDVALVQRLYPEYLKSPAVVKAREAEEAARAKAAEEKRLAKERRLKERLAAIEDQRKKLLAELGVEEDDLTEEDAVLPSHDVDEEDLPDTQVVVLGSDDEFVEASDEDDDDDDDDDDDWGDDEDEEDF